MEVHKTSDIQRKEQHPGNQKSSASQADAHAMKALMKKKETAGEMSSLFSSQTKQVSADLKKRSETDERELRIKKYQEKYRIKEQESEKDNESQREKGQEQAYEDAGELVKAVAEHILISDKDYMDPGSGNEVRIKIKSSILKDAHVHLIQEKDCLRVKLLSSDKQSIQTLIEARSGLEKQLETNYKGLLRIEIVHLTEKGNINKTNDEIR